MKLPRPRFAFAFLITYFLVAPSAVGAPLPAAWLAGEVTANLPQWSRFYIDRHQSPELSYHEKQAAAAVAAALRTAGFEVSEGVGGFGLVGVLRNGSGPVVLVRTDLDALPVLEETGLSYASKVKAQDDLGREVSVMHACGHDLHMTVFTAVAAVLARHREAWKGTLVFVGQPAEERGGGARSMLQAGVYQKFPIPTVAVALHSHAALPVGTVGVVEGFAMANVESVDLTIRGIGGHGAWPQTTRDPIVLASEIILSLQTIVSREIEPGQAAVVTVGSIHGGSKHNIIPDEVKLQLTLRSYKEEVRQLTLASIRRRAENIARAAGVPEDRLPVMKVLSEEFTPALYNDPVLTRRAADVLRQTLGEANVRTVNPVMGGEDFSEFGRTPEKVPVCLFWLGTVAPEKIEGYRQQGKPLPSLHSGAFAPLPEPSIRTGVMAMGSVLLELLARP